MSKYTAKKTKKQDIIDKSTKKKRKDDEMEEINGQFIAEKNID